MSKEKKSNALVRGSRCGAQINTIVKNTTKVRCGYPGEPVLLQSKRRSALLLPGAHVSRKGFLQQAEELGSNHSVEQMCGALSA